jgi:hypothetical protein
MYLLAYLLCDVDKRKNRFIVAELVVATATGETVLRLVMLRHLSFLARPSSQFRQYHLLPVAPQKNTIFPMLRLHLHVDRTEDHRYTWQRHNRFSKKLARLIMHLSAVCTGRLTLVSPEHSLHVEKSQPFFTTTAQESTVDFLQLVHFVVLIWLAIQT